MACPWSCACDPPPHPLSKLLAIQDHTQNLEEQLWMGGRREVSIISHTPVNRSDLQQERSFFHGSVSTFLQLVVAPARIQNLFTHVSDIHSYNTRSATTNKFCVMSSSHEQLKNSFSRRFALACGYRMRYHKILKSLPVETYQRNKCMKRFPVLIFLNKRICTLHHLQFLKY